MRLKSSSALANLEHPPPYNNALLNLFRSYRCAFSPDLFFVSSLFSFQVPSSFGVSFHDPLSPRFTHPLTVPALFLRTNPRVLVSPPARPLTQLLQRSRSGLGSMVDHGGNGRFVMSSLVSPEFSRLPVHTYAAGHPPCLLAGPFFAAYPSTFFVLVACDGAVRSCLSMEFWFPKAWW